MLLIAKNIGGTVEWYAPRRADAGPTVAVLDSSGGTVVAAGTAATLDSVNTTLAAGAAAGDTTLTLTSGASLTAGYRYLISMAGGQSEFVEVDRFSGTTVYLANPLAYPHANGAAFQGTRISYALAAGAVDLEEENCRAVFSWLVSAAAQAEGVVEFTITRHPLYCPASIPDLYRAASSALQAQIATDTSLGDAITRAWDEVLDTLYARSVRASTIVGNDKLKRAVVYKALGLLAETYGKDYRGDREEYQKRYEDMLGVFKVVAATDTDEDGAITPNEKHSRGGELFRE